MPVYVLKCPQCGHEFKGLVPANTQEPKEWVCSECGSHEAKPVDQYPSDFHPLENPHGKGCPCCRGLS